MSGKVIAVATTYSEVVAAIVARRISLGLTQVEVDQLSGVPDGYTGKIEAFLTNPTAPNARMLGFISLPLMLGALDIRLAIQETGKPASQLDARPCRAGILPPSGNDLIRTARSILAERGALGAQAANQARTPAKRRAIARRAARTRWEKARREALRVSKSATRRPRRTSTEQQDASEGGILAG